MPINYKMETYRYGGHSMSDPGTTYRTREEIQHMRSTNDPITGLKLRLLDHSVATEAELKAIDKEVRAEMDAAVVEAKAAPEPSMSKLYEVCQWGCFNFKDIYTPGTEPDRVRGRTSDDWHTYAK